jgi:hypothetical protein
MGNTFVRQDFYIDPPKKDAAAEEWKAWIDKDNRAATNAKRAYTRSQVQGDIPESAQETSMRRVNGVWKATTNIGYVGNEDSGHLEPTIEATQELDFAQARFEHKKRCTNPRPSRSVKRARREARRVAKQKNR